MKSADLDPFTSAPWHEGDQDIRLVTMRMDNLNAPFANKLNNPAQPGDVDAVPHAELDVGDVHCPRGIPERIAQVGRPHYRTDDHIVPALGRFPRETQEYLFCSIDACAID